LGSFYFPGIDFWQETWPSISRQQGFIQPYFYAILLLMPLDLTVDAGLVVASGVVTRVLVVVVGVLLFGPEIGLFFSAGYGEVIVMLMLLRSKYK
jgi:hypothetical protein